MKNIKRKKGLQFSFSWMFAIIVGIVIIFLAVYASTKFLRTGEYEQSSETAKRLATIFDPLETSIQSTRTGVLTLGEEVRLYNDCFTDGSFGRQRFSISGKKSFSSEFGEKGVGTEVYNKYVFSESIIEGEEYSYHTKTFNMPFKVADIIILTSEDYCYIQAPTEVTEEVENLGIKNIRTVSSASSCQEGEITVCFLVEEEPVI